MEAAAAGFRATAGDDHENMRLQCPLYDAPYEYCEGKLGGAATLVHSAPPH